MGLVIVQNFLYFIYQLDWDMQSMLQQSLTGKRIFSHVGHFKFVTTMLFHPVYYVLLICNPDLLESVRRVRVISILYVGDELLQSTCCFHLLKRLDSSKKIQGRLYSGLGCWEIVELQSIIALGRRQLPRIAHRWVECAALHYPAEFLRVLQDEEIL